MSEIFAVMIITIILFCNSNTSRFPENKQETWIYEKERNILAYPDRELKIHKSVMRASE